VTARMSWADPRHDGAGMWTRTPPHSSTRLTLLGTVVVCLLFVLGFVLAQSLARPAMCHLHRTAAGHGAFTYCNDYVQEPAR
jgi:hypothetical protein